MGAQRAVALGGQGQCLLWCLGLALPALMLGGSDAAAWGLDGPLCVGGLRGPGSQAVLVDRALLRAWVGPGLCLVPAMGLLIPS